jgi:FkbM family methyltransferase
MSVDALTINVRRRSRCTSRKPHVALPSFNSSVISDRVAPLIYDIGLHKGEDSEFYLKKGFRVVGVDADPDHCEYARARLAKFVESGQLEVVNVAITDQAGTVTFFRSAKSDWGTVVEEWDADNRDRGYESEPLTVGSITLADLVRDHGAPYFIKIDIEGMDDAALASLAGSPSLPKFISIEMPFPRDSSFRRAKSRIAALTRLGYDAFKIVPQHHVDKQVPPRPPLEGDYVDFRFEFGSSGLFGEEAPGDWIPANTVLRRIWLTMIRHFPEGFLYTRRRLHGAYVGLRERLTGRPESGYWYDIHARRAAATPV